MIAAGSGFVVDPDAPDKVWEFCYAVREFFELVEVKGLLFHDAVTLIAVNSRNDWCRSPRISWDGFRGIRTEGYVVRGEAWCPMSGRWLSFTYDLSTGERTGGSYQEPLFEIRPSKR